MCSITSGGTRNCASGSQPSACFAAATSSGPSGEPCDFAVSIAFGAPNAMWLRTITSEGRSVSAWAAAIACSSAATSSESSTCWTCQPCASKRLPLSSVVYESEVVPSIVMWLSS